MLYLVNQLGKFIFLFGHMKNNTFFPIIKDLREIRLFMPDEYPDFEENRI